MSPDTPAEAATVRAIEVSHAGSALPDEDQEVLLRFARQCAARAVQPQLAIRTARVAGREVSRLPGSAVVPLHRERPSTEHDRCAEAEPPRHGHRQGYGHADENERRDGGAASRHAVRIGRDLMAPGRVGRGLAPVVDVRHVRAGVLHNAGYAAADADSDQLQQRLRQVRPSHAPLTVRSGWLVEVSADPDAQTITWKPPAPEHGLLLGV